MDDWLPIDLHIHTALSPCADNQMTPNNIVNMAKILGLKAIAVTDHQAIDNVPPVLRLAGQAGIVCIPGMEVQSREEIHLLCYFADVEALKQLADRVHDSLDPRFTANARFGEQLIMDEYDRIMGSKQVLLSQSSTLSLEQIWATVEQLGGCCVPAHVDRPAFGLLGQLGFVPSSISVNAVEVSMHGILGRWDMSSLGAENYTVITSSDAHSLEQMVTQGHTLIAPPVLNTKSILSLLGSIRTGLLCTFVMDD